MSFEQNIHPGILTSSVTLHEEQSPSTLSAVSRRGPNFTKNDDVQLCRSWLATPQDQQPGADEEEKPGTFWGRLTTDFLEQLPAVHRSQMSLESRWGVIQHSVKRFSTCLAQVKDENPNGEKKSTEDKLAEAMGLYRDIHGKDFANLRAFNVLVNAPKWIEYCASMDEKKKTLEEKRKGQDDQSKTPQLTKRPASSNSFDNILSMLSNVEGEQETEAEILAGLNKNGSESRPSPNKRIKLTESHGDTLAALLACSERISKAQKALVEETKRQSDALELIASDRIMSKNLTGLDEMSRKYYNIHRKRIMTKLVLEMNQLT